ncbi:MULTISPECIES: hypothetical protein [unclassified Lonepinella]|uniref:hypothetical protein n=1 Tax=unclassified Lonepinella TaxID=2642006 RepID=UPI003F6DECAE
MGDLAQDLQRLQDLREMVTGSRYRLEYFYNQLHPKEKQWWCGQMNIDYCHDNGKPKQWHELSKEDREDLRRFYRWLERFFGRMPKGLRNAEFQWVTEHETEY